MSYVLKDLVVQVAHLLLILFFLSALVSAFLIHQSSADELLVLHQPSVALKINSGSDGLERNEANSLRKGKRAV